MQLTETAGKVLPSWHYTNAEKLAAHTGKNLLSETEIGWTIFSIYEKHIFLHCLTIFQDSDHTGNDVRWSVLLCQSEMKFFKKKSFYQWLIQEHVLNTVNFPDHNNVVKAKCSLKQMNFFFFFYKTCFMIKSQTKICWVFNVKIQQNPSTCTVKWEYLLANFNSSKQNPLVFVSQHWIFLFPLPSEKCSHQLRPIFLLIYRQMLQLLPHFFHR